MFASLKRRVRAVKLELAALALAVRFVSAPVLAECRERANAKG
jgi:hypothetical protein